MTCSGASVFLLFLVSCFSFLLSTVECRGGSGGGGRGSKVSKIDRILNQNKTHIDDQFTFMKYETKHQSKKLLPKTGNFSESFSELLRTSLPLAVDVEGVFYYRAGDNVTTHRVYNDTGPEVCIFYLEAKHVPDDPELAGEGVVYECNATTNTTVVSCCPERHCCEDHIVYVKRIGKGAFTLIIFATIVLILGLMVVWVYYSKSQEIKKRKLEDEEFEAKKIKPKPVPEKPDSERSNNSVPPDPVPS